LFDSVLPFLTKGKATVNFIHRHSVNISVMNGFC
jgi:hypothetical protein